MKARVLWQSCVVAVAGCVASGTSFAQSTVDCSGVTEDMARLKCYDEQAARQKKAAAQSAASAKSAAPTAATPPAAVDASAKAAAAPAASAATPAPVASAARPTSASSDFGLDPEAVRRKQAASNPSAPKEPEQLTARVTAVATKARGAYLITLEDGQVWEETQHNSSTIPPEVGETVTIKRGMLGSYFLSGRAALALRVKRVH